jgi:hypothetical protein
MNVKNETMSVERQMCVLFDALLLISRELRMA